MLQIYEPRLLSYPVVPQLLSHLSSLSARSRCDFTPVVKVLSGGSVVAVICTLVLRSPSIRLFACIPRQIYCFMTSWNWTLVLLRLMSRNKINSFSRISCSFSASIIRIILGAGNDILQHSEALMECARNPRKHLNLTLNLYRRQPVCCLFLNTTF